MAATSTKTGHSTGRIATIAGAVATALLLSTSAGVAQAADSNDRIVPPSAAEVALLRGLLALQHPSLKAGATAPQARPASVPTVATEPGKATSEPISSTESEASLEAPERTAGVLDSRFRRSLERSLAAAGYEVPNL